MMDQTCDECKRLWQEYEIAAEVQRIMESRSSGYRLTCAGASPALPGFQIGASETDVMLLVMNDGGMKHLLSDKFTIGGEATAAAGPVGRDASAQTDAMMHAEMLSYSRSRGLFAGISLEGATLRPDEETNRELYGRDATNREILTGDFKIPAVAGKFEHALNRESPQRQH